MGGLRIVWYLWCVSCSLPLACAPPYPGANAPPIAHRHRHQKVELALHLALPGTLITHLIHHQVRDISSSFVIQVVKFHADIAPSSPNHHRTSRSYPLPGKVQTQLFASNALPTLTACPSRPPCSHLSYHPQTPWSQRSSLLQFPSNPTFTSHSTIRTCAARPIHHAEPTECQARPSQGQGLPGT